MGGIAAKSRFTPEPLRMSSRRVHLDLGKKADNLN